MGRIFLYLAVFCMVAFGSMWMIYQWISTVRPAAVNRAADIEMMMDQGSR